ncbi:MULTISPECIES: hypothetical protein [Pectobacterium]|uniref:Lysogenic conversion protein n=1 Tax=Pectobacterium versatile TaxID=2488639 RepID=A0AAW3RWC2_9GAMM|nr:MULTISPECIES: hypothetical protein [Pectobacterium]MBA0160306.1 hypothetical protein [Pectobacterium versatile]POE18518.1 hypothetical protein BV923_21060 [Pectobacterium odoriferum]
MGFIHFLSEHISEVGAIITTVSAFLTAVATFFLWRVTKILAIETRRMVDASSQPHVVVTLEPNMWTVLYFDINVSNTGNAAAYNIEIEFDPPLINGSHRNEIPIPFNNISVLKNGQTLNSNLCEFKDLKGRVFNVNISWSKGINSSVRQSNSYYYNMEVFENITYLGARSPLTQIAEQLKGIREDWRSIARGQRRLEVNNYTAKDRFLRRKQDEEYFKKIKKQSD